MTIMSGMANRVNGSYDVSVTYDTSRYYLFKNSNLILLIIGKRDRRQTIYPIE